VPAFALPRDADGQIAPHDHPELAGAARMIRGVTKHHIVPDANRGCRRLSSALFRNHPKRQGYLSFLSEPCLQANGVNSVDHIVRSSWDGAVVITVERFRSFDPAQAAADKWKIGLVPLEDPPEPCHGAVWGTISEGKANDIRRATDWLVSIPNVVIDETAQPILGGGQIGG
jgi:hypothetical protein